MNILSRVTEMLDDPLFILDNGGNIVYVNTAAGRKLGYSPDYLEGRKFTSILDFDPEFSDDLDTDTVKGTVYRRLTIKDRQNASIYFNAKIREDIIEKERFIYILLHDTGYEFHVLDKFEKAFNSSPALMAITRHSDKCFADVNRAFMENTGYSKDEIIGKTAPELNLFFKKDSGYSRLTQALAVSDSIKDLEILVRRKDGTQIEGLYSSEIINDRGERYIFSVMQDITEKNLKERELENFFNVNLDLLCIADTNGYFIKCNESWKTTLGYDVHDLEGRRFLDFIHPDDLDATLKAVSYLEQGQDVLNFTNRYRTKDGNYRFIEWRSKPSGKLIYAAARDITVHLETLSELESQRQRLSNIIEGTNIGTWEWNIETGETVFNDRWAEIIGYTLEELEPVSIKTWSRFLYEEDLERSGRKLEDHFSGKEDFYECEVRMKHKDGSLIWVLDRGKVIKRTDEGKPLMMFGTHSDITGQKKLEEKLHRASIIDPLTDLYNRRHLFNRLEEIVNRYKREHECFSLSIIDVDHFKMLNDTFGHLAGDCVLKHFSDLLKSRLRSYDLLGRYGGEEFLIAMPRSTRFQAERKISSIISELNNLYVDYNGSKISYTFSCGVADADEMTSEGLTATVILSAADQRLYKAKKWGRNRVVSD